MCLERFKPDEYSPFATMKLDDEQVDHALYVEGNLHPDIKVADLRVETKGQLFDLVAKECRRIQSQQPMRTASMQNTFGNVTLVAVELGFPREALSPIAMERHWGSGGKVPLPLTSASGTQEQAMVVASSTETTSAAASSAEHQDASDAQAAHQQKLEDKKPAPRRRVAHVRSRFPRIKVVPATEGADPKHEREKSNDGDGTCLATGQKGNTCLTGESDEKEKLEDDETGARPSKQTDAGQEPTDLAPGPTTSIDELRIAAKAREEELRAMGSDLTCASGK